MTARRSTTKAPTTGEHRHAMVRGVRSRPHGFHRQGRRAGLRPLACQRRAACRCGGQADRPQQRGAGDEEDRCLGSGHLRSRPRARRRRACAGTRGGDGGRRLRFSGSRDRGLRSDGSGRERTRRLRRCRCLSLHRARRLSHRRDGGADGAAAGRQRARRCRDVPLDDCGAASRRRRISSRSGARTKASAAAPLSIPILPGSLRGTWRVAAYTDPKGSSVGDGKLPGRGLRARAAGTDPDAEGGRSAAGTAGSHRSGGALSLRRTGAATLAVTGEVTVAAASASGIKGTRRLRRSASTTSRSRLRPPRSSRMPPPTRRDAPACRSRCRRWQRRGPTEARITLRVAEAGGRAVERSVTLPILPEGPGGGRAQELRRAAWRGRERHASMWFLPIPTGRRLASGNVAWSLYKIERRYQWYNSDGRWGYEPIKVHTPRGGRPHHCRTRWACTHFGSGGVGHLQARCECARSRRDRRRPACPSRSGGRATRRPTRRTFST